MQCLSCNKNTSNPKFCSKSCASSFNNREFPKRSITRKCKYCDSLVKSSRSTVCVGHSTSMDDLLTRTIGEERKKLRNTGVHRSWLHSSTRGRTRSYHRNLLDLPCYLCSYTKHVQLAHIIPVSAFPDRATLAEVSSAYNIVQLCPNCHWEFDHSLLGRESRDRMKPKIYSKELLSIRIRLLSKFYPLSRGEVNNYVFWSLRIYDYSRAQHIA